MWIPTNISVSFFMRILYIEDKTKNWTCSWNGVYYLPLEQVTWDLIIRHCRLTFQMKLIFAWHILIALKQWIALLVLLLYSIHILKSLWSPITTISWYPCVILHRFLEDIITIPYLITTFVKVDFQGVQGFSNPMVFVDILSWWHI